MYQIIYFLIQHTLAIQTLKYVQSENALCLDGSRASYYYEDGSGDGVDKYLIFFEGGGWIQGFDQEELLQQAYDRSNTNMGSSKFSPSSMTMDGLFNRNKNVNPYFYNWNTIFVNYCDGTGHQGYKTDPLLINNKLIYIRGEAIFKSIFQEYQTKLSKASKVLVSGCSAGGLAVFSWIQYIRDRLPSQVLVLAAPDSGIFLDLQPYDSEQAASDRRQKQYHKIANVEVDPLNEKCVASYPQDKWKCHFAQYLLNFITVPVFFMQSLYDTACIPNILHIRNAYDYTLNRCDNKERACIEAMRKQMQNLITDRLQQDSLTGSWAVACLEHWYLLLEISFTQKQSFYTSNWAVPNSSQWTISNSLGQWVQNQELDNIHMDSVYWPSNNGCSNV